MRFTANHAIMVLASLGAAGAEAFAQCAASGNQLPFHLTAAAALAIATAFGAASKSVMSDKDKPAVAVASDVLRAVADSLDASGGATSLHVAVLDAIKQNVAILPPPVK